MLPLCDFIDKHYTDAIQLHESSLFATFLSSARDAISAAGEEKSILGMLTVLQAVIDDILLPPWVEFAAAVVCLHGKDNSDRSIDEFSHGIFPGMEKLDWFVELRSSLVIALVFECKILQQCQPDKEDHTSVARLASEFRSKESAVYMTALDIHGQLRNSRPSIWASILSAADIANDVGNFIDRLRAVLTSATTPPEDQDE